MPAKVLHPGSDGERGDLTQGAVLPAGQDVRLVDLGVRLR